MLDKVCSAGRPWFRLRGGILVECGQWPSHPRYGQWLFFFIILYKKNLSRSWKNIVKWLRQWFFLTSWLDHFYWNQSTIIQSRSARRLEKRLMKWSWCTFCKKIRRTTDRKELVKYSARQFGIKGMELKVVRVRIVWVVTRGGLRPTWSLWQTDALSFVFLVNAGP